MYNYLTLTRIAGGFLFRSAHISVGKYSLDLNRLKPIIKKTGPSLTGSYDSIFYRVSFFRLLITFRRVNSSRSFSSSASEISLASCV